MADADHPVDRLVVEAPRKVDKLALGAAAFDAAVDEVAMPAES